MKDIDKMNIVIFFFYRSQINNFTLAVLLSHFGYFLLYVHLLYVHLFFIVSTSILILSYTYIIYIIFIHMYIFFICSYCYKSNDKSLFIIQICNHIIL